MAKIIEKIKKSTYPIMILHGVVVFPHIPTAFEVDDEKYIKMLKSMKRDERTVFLAFSEGVADDDAINDVGVICDIKHMSKIPDSDAYKVIAEGVCRSELVSFDLDGDVPSCEVATRVLIEEDSYRNNTQLEYLKKIFEENKPLFSRLNNEFLEIVSSIDDASMLCDFLAANLLYSFRDKIRILSLYDVSKRVEQLDIAFHDEKEIFLTEKEITRKVQEKLSGNQRDIFLREQMKIIRSELGEDDEDEDELWVKICEAKIPQDIKEKFEKEYAKMNRMAFGSAEATVIRNYLETCLEIPWGVYTKDKINTERARKILERDHYGLEKVKERILEYISVKQLSPDLKGQILCLVGPPGVGKTSIAYSIARALNRKMARLSLGGVHDEADIRGHRKTYVGAMPGRIMTALSQAGSSNPLLLLDEVDKMGSDYRGDPSAALLEVLDSEQNGAYRDNYLEIPYDLSDVMFIATANTLDTIPRPLLDRMEVIELGSYTDEEKLMIAKDHLIPKQLAKHGLKKTQLRITDDAIREIISCYTRESGVRNLERQFANICRKADMELLQNADVKRISINGSNVEQYLGTRKFLPDRLPLGDQIGLVTGLAWTSVGGEVLEVEVNVMDGTGKLELTGNLGDVMKESAHAALSYIRANASTLGVPADFYKTKDIHVHFPEGAVPKDGPSAGVTVCTAMVSALTGTTVRSDVAMTGEISIRGRVLPIGGLKEKTMAALRHGIRTVIIPKENEKDLEQIDQTVRRALNFVSAQTVDAVLDTALNRKINGVAPALLNTLPEDVKGKSRKPGIRQ